MPRNTTSSQCLKAATKTTDNTKYTQKAKYSLETNRTELDEADVDDDQKDDYDNDDDEMERSDYQTN